MIPPPSAFADALVLTGPTGSGKSAVALELALRLPAEIVALDSMTVYRGMDIGTAKPAPADRARVPHHLIDVLNPWESASVAWWLERAAEACVEIRSRGKRPLFVGGTPFFLKALMSGLFDSPPVDPAIRTKWEAEAERLGPEGLHARLAEVDPVSARRLHPNDVRRVVRALEVREATGKPLSEAQQNWKAPPAVLPCVLLDWPRAELYRRIDARVDSMLAGGWVEEVQRLRELPRPLSKEASQALGYPEILAELNGTGPGWAETTGLIKTRTRQFAKRQLTWFRSLPGCCPCPATEPDLPGRVLRLWEEGILLSQGSNLEHGAEPDDN